MPGLDPGIHHSSREDELPGVKPGNDTLAENDT
jgi:hypothetical protein